MIFSIQNIGRASKPKKQKISFMKMKGKFYFTFFALQSAPLCALVYMRAMPSQL